MKKIYEVQELVKMAKRENNNKRNYLFVNPIQGKHIPTSPRESFILFSQLASLIETRYQGKRVLTIGFAETATAIGIAASIKAKNVIYNISTTRENVEKTDYLFFSESHSHATEQKLATSGLEEIVEKIDSIVFIEDEVTTGNTIEKLIHEIEKSYKRDNLSFGIVSIINSMTEERISELERKDIFCDYVLRIPHEYNSLELERHNYSTPSGIADSPEAKIKTYCIKKKWNQRIATGIEQINDECESFIDEVIGLGIFDCDCSKVLIIGTEEFMYPAMKLGLTVQTKYPETSVMTHSVTRSPIEVSTDKDYPLFCRNNLVSLYDQNRRTFIYNLEKYDKVIIVTDADPIQKNGLDSLALALKENGNTEVILIRWIRK